MVEDICKNAGIKPIQCEYAQDFCTSFLKIGLPHKVKLLIKLTEAGISIGR